MEGVIFNMANKRVFKVATASAVAASALVAAVPASAASVTYEQAEKQVNVAREAANGLHAEYTKNADYKTKVDIKEANDELNRAKAKIAALSDAKQKAYLSSRIQGTIDTVARANAYNNAVRVGTEILPAAHQAVVKAADVESLKEGNVLLAAKIKQAKETFPKVYGKEMQTSFASMYLTAELEADRKDGHYAAITADRVAEGLKLIAAGKVEEAEVQYKNAEASFKVVKGLATIKDIIAADWTELGKKIEAAKVAKVESVSAIDVNKIEVKFNKAVDTTKAAVKLTKGLVNYNVTAEWNEAKDTVVLTSVLNKLTPDEYTVKVEGLTEEALTASVKVEEEKAAKLEVLTSSVDVVANGGSGVVYFDVLNQYGKKFTTADFSDLTVTTTESIADVSFSGVTEAASSDSKKGSLKGTFTVTDASSKLKAGDTFKVTAVYKGLTASKDVSFVDASKIAELSFGQVAPLKDKKRISIGDNDLVVPYTALDQYGQDVELAVINATWVSSNNDVVNPSSLEVTEDGKLTVDAGSTAGTAILTAILPNGKTAQFSVVVEAAPSAKTIQLSGPTSLLADGEKASLDIVVYDQFGEVIPNKDVAGLNFSGGFAINAKTGKLEGTVTENKAFKVTVSKAGTELAAVTFGVEAKAEANTITSVSFPTLFEVESAKEITLDDVVVKDQYGRVFTPESIALTEVDAANDKFSLSGDEVTAAAAGSKVYTVSVDDSASAVKNITLTAVESSAIKTYELASIGTIYNGGAEYYATPELVGKTAEGKTVVLKADKIATLTSSNSSVAAIEGKTVKGALASDAADATATIKAWDANGALLGTTTVTVTNAAPKLTKIDKAEAVGATVADIFTSKDQYGVAFAEQGTWYFTNSSDVTKSTSTAAATFASDAPTDTFDLAAGDYTVKFVSKDGDTVVTSTITFE